MYLSSSQMSRSSSPHCYCHLIGSTDAMSWCWPRRAVSNLTSSVWCQSSTNLETWVHGGNEKRKRRGVGSLSLSNLYSHILIWRLDKHVNKDCAWRDDDFGGSKRKSSETEKTTFMRAHERESEKNVTAVCQKVTALLLWKSEKRDGKGHFESVAIAEFRRYKRVVYDALSSFTILCLPAFWRFPDLISKQIVLSFFLRILFQENKKVVNTTRSGGGNRMSGIGKSA